MVAIYQPNNRFMPPISLLAFYDVDLLFCNFLFVFMPFFVQLKQLQTFFEVKVQTVKYMKQYTCELLIFKVRSTSGVKLSTKCYLKITNYEAAQFSTFHQLYFTFPISDYFPFVHYAPNNNQFYRAGEETSWPWVYILM